MQRWNGRSNEGHRRTRQPIEGSRSLQAIRPRKEERARRWGVLNAPPLTKFAPHGQIRVWAPRDSLWPRCNLASGSGLQEDKVPGPNGFNAEFYKATWHIIRDDAVRFVNYFPSHGFVSKHVSATNIVLIPKKEGATSLKAYRPISLTTSYYKIIAKLLAERLKKVVDSLISNEQTAFIPKRQILDAAMTVHEVVDSLQRSGTPAVLLKLDLEKAFDRMNWSMLLRIMELMEFPAKWRKWMATCILSACFSINLNGGTFGFIKGTRGLRQGDPLSPLFFNIVAEGLLALIRWACDERVLENIMPTGGLPISQFADDTVLFIKADETQIQTIKCLIYAFEICSGQRINWGKSSIFGINQNSEGMSRWASILGCTVGQFSSSYLGLPLFCTRITKGLWDNVAEKMQRRLSTWKRRQLSKAGRLVLIKTCMAEIPTYHLSFLHCPASVALNLEKLMRKFLWSGNKEVSKMSMVTWE
ncbi:hypothetical protein H6P81_007249 [Aristolochia fimbriata]|uniref:Reverse transcriptase domain-containing protein n=1 Tax=Aristolochia fimbriata TaxID=158543 RepID=A0AAV7F1V0_ARIFI|nr:hypothetical protein H6P81_007249 [Aristolochia fimbriata]